MADFKIGPRIGINPDEAKAALDEAVRLFLATASEAGTLQVVLEEAGYE